MFKLLKIRSFALCGAVSERSSVHFILKTLKLYQKWISPFLRKSCRFWPSCSEYAFLAIKKEGTVKGFWKSLKRILRCHPFHQGGVDLP